MSTIDELKNTGLKATLPRLKILEIFQKGEPRHMTAEDVFRILLQDRTDIGSGNRLPRVTSVRTSQYFDAQQF